MHKTVLISGGNRGIGLAAVKLFAQLSGYKVLMGTRNIENGLNQIKELSGDVHAVELDLADSNGLELQMNKILKNFGPIDVLVNNAAVLNEGKALDISNEKFQEAVQVNVLAAYQMIKFFTPEMIKNNYGRIVNISSGWGSFSDGLTGPFSYSFTKASLNALTLTVSRELPSNIKINSMCPGWVRTRMGGEGATRSPEEGAATALWLGTLSDDGPSGKFFRDKSEIAW